MKTTLSSPLPDARRRATRSLLVDHASVTAAPPATARSAWTGPVRMGLLATAAAAVAGVVTVASFVGPTTEPAYASWTAVPKTSTGTGASPSGDDLAGWVSQCADLKVGGVTVGGVDGSAGADRRKVLVDRRGEVTFCVDVVLGSGIGADPLVAFSGLRADGLNTMAARVSSDPFDPPTGGDVLVLGGDTTTPPAEPVEEGGTTLEVYQLFGLAGDDVTGVDIVLTNDLRVTATLTDGIWGAWWPDGEGDPTGAQLDLRTADGRTTTVDVTAVLLP